tara:strand:+ start:337 stop:558 length:222 start_codon:yes stop_codon:yes gene_type:complete
MTYTIQIAWAGNFEVKQEPIDVLDQSLEMMKFTDPEGRPILVKREHFCGMYPTPKGWSVKEKEEAEEEAKNSM